MDSYARWRAEVEAELAGRSFEKTLVTTTHDGVRIEPLYPEAPPSSPLAPRASAPCTGSVLGPAVSAPEGPALAWWWGEPGSIAGSTRAVVAETDAFGGWPTGLDVIVIGGESSTGARVASPAALDAAEAGGGAVAELASAFVALARAVGESALPSELAVALSLSTDFFVDIAKLRAARLGIAGILAGAGHRERALPLAVRQTFRSLSNVDVETNALRSTVAGAAGLIGGATHVALFAHDAASIHTKAEAAARLAWTQGEVLTRESHLDLFSDAAEGATFLVALTDQLGEAAWTLARKALGGDDAALAARIESDAAARARALATRKKPLVGVSRFPGTPTGVGGEDRDTTTFEMLRERGMGRRAAVVALGDPKLDARVDFAREVLEVAGLEVSVAPRASDVAGALAALDPAARIAIVATADAALAAEAVELTEALSQRGLVVLVAGRPGDAESTLRAAGARAFVFVGQDIVETMNAVLGGAS